MTRSRSLRSEPLAAARARASELRTVPIVAMIAKEVVNSSADFTAMVAAAPTPSQNPAQSRSIETMALSKVNPKAPPLKSCFDWQVDHNLNLITGSDW